MGLLAGSLVLLWPNTQLGLSSARSRLSHAEAFQADIRDGVPQFLLIRRHTPWLHHFESVLTETLPMLREAGIPPYDGIVPDPPFREVPGPRSPSSISLARWDEATRTIEATNVDPWAVFSLPERTYVAGLRIRYAHDNGTSTPARFKLAWRRSDQEGWPDDQAFQRWTLPTGSDEVLAWVGEPIDEFRIQPDNRPCTFRIESLTLILPDRAARPGLDRHADSADIGPMGNGIVRSAGGEGVR